MFDQFICKHWDNFKRDFQDLIASLIRWCQTGLHTDPYSWTGCTNQPVVGMKQATSYSSTGQK